MRRKKPVRHEDKVQAKLLAELTFALLPDVYVYAIPNGGFRLKSEAVRMKSTGTKSGIADLVFIAPKWRTYWLEMKQSETRGSRPSDEQLGFAARCKRNDHPYAIAYSVDEAMDFLRLWGLLRSGY